MNSSAEGVPRAPASVAELLASLDRIDGALPKRLKQCAICLRANLDRVAVSTVADMAQLAEVPPSAFMRFCQTLGLSGYSEMQALFRAEYAQMRPDYTERLTRLRAEGASGAGRLAADFAEAGIRSLMDMSKELDAQQLQAVAERLAGARTIHLVGLRRAFAVVVYLAYLLDKMGVASMLHHTTGQIESDHAIGPDDALFAVTFAPFSQETLTLAKRVSERGIPVLAMSDTTTCPLVDVAENLLIAREVEVGGFRAPNAGLALVTALAVAIGGLRKEKA
ncbi:MurR/RpiR family transcriptional regulator [Aurantimonas coralicida]|uniref:MurR/RpiR family transcriptional regulator n=1 Tax=Aurantimonas coralicida TaxID=182270 RepID=UPI001E2B6A9F|nr:MurR/RpiR family transcriptional regulator [Aurantimonas coralicida]MCD1641664.1 MurR/RpiR family transcriptional regulator [Aurantimonas coralicida]